MTRICGHCGNEVDGNDEYCPACGRSLQTEVVQREGEKKEKKKAPEPDGGKEVKEDAEKKPVQSAPAKDKAAPRRQTASTKKGMPRVGVIFLVLALCLCAVILKDYAASKPEKDKKETVPDNLPQVKDVLIQHEAYHTASSDYYDEYWIVFYGNDTKIVKAITLQVKFDKESGYDRETVEGIDADEAYPGISSIPTMDSWVEENEDSFDYILRIQKLDEPENLKKLHDTGFITLSEPDSGKAMDAIQFMNLMEEKGAEKVSIGDYEKLHLCFQID